mgnify:CR=1 FL=1
MKIAIIGSTGLTPRMFEHKMELEAKGHTVTMPTFDDDETEAIKILQGNREKIAGADQVHLIWDGRSPGTILDIGITIGLYRPLKIIYLEPKTMPDIAKKYAEEWKYETF